MKITIHKKNLITKHNRPIRMIPTMAMELNSMRIITSRYKNDQLKIRLGINNRETRLTNLQNHQLVKVIKYKKNIFKIIETSMLTLKVMFQSTNN